MKKSTKGALAAAAAGTLLLGGAGSLAFWNATATVGGTTVNSGSLTLSAGSCSQFVLDNGEVVAGANLIASIVPGDTITKTCTSKIGATGDHLRATLGTNATGGAGGDLTSHVTVNSSFKVAGASVTEITEGNNGDSLTATIKITFPYGTSVDNSSQGLSLALANYVVTATQVHGADPVTP
ncbi:alternate-type signal peptide domain-containing protein [Aeromicrobium sp.]|uniref:alternate-type signal peptide domain-containing protein n=1 Tax=Aeromicrobium sp. TaxID=1871063 RepID=UPI0019B33759|nr:alternate-type signal peptide domain-containing protein [Aeromicrobium sp.]MBC7630670.1 alternate-type signal peptide domain-containing protein [Aeromicrobium sp.]